MTRTKQTGLAFHVHHDTLVEWCHDYQERVDYINKDKPEHERELRLRLFKLIPNDRLPPGLIGAWEARCKAWEAHSKAGEAHCKAWEAYQPQLKALHAELCPDCPWNGCTIFPEEAK